MSISRHLSGRFLDSIRLGSLIERKHAFIYLMILLAFPVLQPAYADVPESSAEGTEVEATDDPLEPMNRAIFDTNDFLDRLLIRPLAELYRFTTPSYVRDRVSGVVTDMGEPVTFANDLLQGEFGKAGTTLERFGMNTTLGVGGMWDVAASWADLPQQTGDFGQTLNSWGVGSGPYLVLPLLGPSNFRDAAGTGVDAVMSPWPYIISDAGGSSITRDEFDIVSFSAQGIVKREQNIETLDALRSGSLDYYAQMRSVYRQYRDKQLGNSPTENAPKFEDYE
jgi:phospholipid-binding lipoprotein MlaA